MSRVVDPRPWVEQRVKEVKPAFLPKLQAGQLAVKEARTRAERKAAKMTLRSLKRDRKQALREASRLLGLPVAWFKPSTSLKRRSAVLALRDVASCMVCRYRLGLVSVRCPDERPTRCSSMTKSSCSSIYHAEPVGDHIEALRPNRLRPKLRPPEVCSF